MFYFIVTHPASLGDGVGGGGGGRRWLSHFSECLYRMDLGQIGILGGNWHFRWGGFFQEGLGNSLYKKIVNRNLKQQNDSNCNFYNSSLLLLYPNKFLVGCTCILIFYCIYPPTYKNFFCEGLFFCVL